jgi:hypothetical protein
VKVIWDSLVQPFSERRKDALQLWLWMANWKAADEAHFVLETADIHKAAEGSSQVQSRRPCQSLRSSNML